MNPEKLTLWSVLQLLLLFCPMGFLVGEEQRKNGHSFSVTYSIMEILAYEWSNSLTSHYNIIFLPIDVTKYCTSARDILLMGKHQVAVNKVISLEGIFARLKFQLEEFHETSLSSAIMIEQEDISDAVRNARNISGYYVHANGKTDRQLLLILVINETPTAEDIQTFEETSLAKLSPFFAVDTPVYVVTPRKETTTEGSPLQRFTIIWEIFSVKNKSIVQKLEFSNKTVLVPVMIARRSNYNLAPIVATSVAADPEVNDAIASFKEEQGRLRFHKGCSVSILQDIADCLNFTIVAKRSWTYMSLSSPGKLTGDGRFLLEAQADVSIFLAYITELGGGLLQPLIPVTVDRLQAFFRQPSTNSVSNIFILPFSRHVWLTLALMWLLLATAIFTTFWLLPNNPNGFFNRNPGVAASDAFICIFSIICQRSTPFPSRNISKLLILLIAWLLAYILYTTYCCSIISSKTINDVPIKTLSELLDRKFIILAEDNHFASFLSKPKDKDSELVQDLTSYYVDDKDAASKIFAGNYAFLSSLDIIGPLSQSIGRSFHEFCSSIDSITLKDVVVYSGFYVTKGSPYKESFNYRILQLMEKGLISKYINTLYRKNKPRCPPLPNKFQNLTLKDVHTAFVICFTGSFLSLLFLGLERLYNNIGRTHLTWPPFGMSRPNCHVVPPPSPNIKN